MSDSGHPEMDSPAAEPSSRAQGTTPRTLSRWVVVMPAVALVVGLVLGGLVVSVAQEDAETADRAASPSPSPTASSSEGSGTAVIAPDSCLAAAETVRQATEVIRAGVESIREFRAEEIIDLLNQLETLDSRAREQAATCSGTTVTDAPLETESPASPSASTSGAS